MLFVKYFFKFFSPLSRYARRFLSMIARNRVPRAPDFLRVLPQSNVVKITIFTATRQPPLGVADESYALNLTTLPLKDGQTLWFYIRFASFSVFSRRNWSNLSSSIAVRISVMR